MNYFKYLSVCILIISMFSCNYQSNSEKEDIKKDTTETTNISSKLSNELTNKTDTLHIEIPDKIHYEEDIYFGMTLKEWNKALAIETQSGKHDRVEIENNDSYIAILGYEGSKHIVRGHFRNPKTMVYDQKNRYEILTRNHQPISEPILLAIEVEQDGWSGLNLINELVDYTSSLNFVYGDNPIYQVHQSSNGREKGLYENADIYVSISISSNEEDAKSKKDYKEFSNAFAGNKHEEATIEEFLNYKSITITSSKRLLPINPDIYMNYADKQRMKEVNESNNLINKALENN